MTKSSPSVVPANIRKHLLDGVRFLESNDMASAERCANFALALAPNHPQPIALLGRVLRRQGRVAEAVASLSEAVFRHPHEFEPLQELARALADSGQFSSAIDRYKDALAVNADAQTWFELGNTCDRNSQGEDALKAAQQSIRLAPQHMPSRFLRARALTATGRIEDAAAEYRSLARRPAQAAKAWFGLLDLKTVRLDNKEVLSIEKLESDPRTTESDRVLAGFALGQAYESAARYSDAVLAVQRANRLMRRSIAWSAESHTRQIHGIARVFANLHGAEPDEVGFPVIFIVGMPRSGSTLVEQILAAHPDVEAAGELPDVDVVIAGESHRRGQEFSEWAADATIEDWRRLGDDYLKRTQRWHETGRFTDKMPANWKYVGALRRMLPGARFILSERDLLETCWSCHKQMFSPGRINFSYDWVELAHYAKDCRLLWRGWESLYPERCRAQSHEALQADPEDQVRELLAFCGLEFDSACLDFHIAKRVVRTASAAQVREPLRRNTARALRYGDCLVTLARVLEEVNDVHEN